MFDFDPQEIPLQVFRDGFKKMKGKYHNLGSVIYDKKLNRTGVVIAVRWDGDFLCRWFAENEQLN